MPIKTLDEKFAHELRDIYDAEHRFMETQQQMAEQADDSQLQKMLQKHVRQTEQQIKNLEQVFSALGEQPQGHVSPPIEGIKKQGDELVQKVPDELVDSVIVGGAVDTEHFEISTYEGLITKAEAMGEEDVVALLQENLEQEQNMLNELTRKAQQLAQQAATQIA